MTNPPTTPVSVTVPHLAEAVVVFGWFAIAVMWIAIRSMGHG
jgi:hypothetical protein